MLLLRRIIVVVTLSLLPCFARAAHLSGDYGAFAAAQAARERAENTARAALVLKEADDCLVAIGRAYVAFLNEASHADLTSDDFFRAHVEPLFATDLVKIHNRKNLLTPDEAGRSGSRRLPFQIDEAKKGIGDWVIVNVEINPCGSCSMIALQFDIAHTDDKEHPFATVMKFLWVNESSKIYRIQEVDNAIAR